MARAPAGRCSVAAQPASAGGGRAGAVAGGFLPDNKQSPALGRNAASAPGGPPPSRGPPPSPRRSPPARPPRQAVAAVPLPAHKAARPFGGLAAPPAPPAAAGTAVTPAGQRDPGPAGAAGGTCWGRGGCRARALCRGCRIVRRGGAGGPSPPPAFVCAAETPAPALPAPTPPAGAPTGPRFVRAGLGDRPSGDTDPRLPAGGGGGVGIAPAREMSRGGFATAPQTCPCPGRCRGHTDRPPGQDELRCHRATAPGGSGRAAEAAMGGRRTRDAPPEAERGMLPAGGRSSSPRAPWHGPAGHGSGAATPERERGAAAGLGAGSGHRRGSQPRSPVPVPPRRCPPGHCGRRPGQRAPSRRCCQPGEPGRGSPAESGAVPRCGAPGWAQPRCGPGPGEARGGAAAAGPGAGSGGRGGSQCEVRGARGVSAPLARGGPADKARGRPAQRMLLAGAGPPGSPGGTMGRARRDPRHPPPAAPGSPLRRAPRTCCSAPGRDTAPTREPCPLGAEQPSPAPHPTEASPSRCRDTIALSRQVTRHRRAAATHNLSAPRYPGQAPRCRDTPLRPRLRQHTRMSRYTHLSRSSRPPRKRVRSRRCGKTRTHPGPTPGPARPRPAPRYLPLPVPLPVPLRPRSPLTPTCAAGAGPRPPRPIAARSGRRGRGRAPSRVGCARRD
ncbi:basic proline-rich protein-like [Manacus candei]|uniref:basic proline-rich protein-like n=1 Tax=Manacus candei TaxID=415023 RepID=UPI0022263236|nr:basic proline-rich protein-like [Manacus candei]